jgi:putative transposase
VTESFNGKFRDECLSLEWFRSRAEAKVMIEKWRRHYNEIRPHSSLGYLTPSAFAASAREPRLECGRISL